MALLCLITTPSIDHKLPSPAELLLGRAIQDNLPREIPRDALNEVVTPRLEERQELQKFYHDRSARQLPALTPGQRVSIQDQTTLKWKPAEVREKLAGVPRSYAVSTPTGRELRRTRTHIRPAPPPPPPEQHRSQTRYRWASCGTRCPLWESSCRTPRQLCNSEWQD